MYRDDWPKPEMFCALGDVEALCGFREPPRTYALFARLGVPEATALVAGLAEGGAAELEAVFARLLRLTEADHGLVAQVVTAAAEVHAQPGGDPELAEFARTAVELDEFYPGDQGILAALLMNRVRFGAGEALFLPAGNLHAYLRGTGVEIMANSDNVLRGGLTGKHIAVDELLSILDFTPGSPPLVTVQEQPAGVFRYRTPAPEFTLWRIEVTGVGRPVPATGSGRVLLAVDGRLAVHAAGTADGLVLVRGEAAFATAGEDLRVGGSGTLFVAGPGV